MANFMFHAQELVSHRYCSLIQQRMEKRRILYTKEHYNKKSNKVNHIKRFLIATTIQNFFHYYSCARIFIKNTQYFSA